MAYKTKQSKDITYTKHYNLSAVLESIQRKLLPTHTNIFLFHVKSLRNFHFDMILFIRISWFDHFHWLRRIQYIEIDKLIETLGNKPANQFSVGRYFHSNWHIQFVSIEQLNSVCLSQYFIMSLPSVSRNNAHEAVISICKRHCKPFFSWLAQ